MSKIQFLPKESQDKLTSSQIISFCDVIEQLLLNSIDSSSKLVEVFFDFNSALIEVSDNGEGISLDNLHMIPRKYSTSKSNPKKFFYGFRGMSLFTISQVSNLEITSRHNFSNITHKKKFSKSKNKWDIITSPMGRQKGTTIRCSDCFSQFSVRKHILRENSHKELSRIRKMVTQYNVIHPAISIVIKTQNDEIIYDSRRHIWSSSYATEIELQVLNVEKILQLGLPKYFLTPVYIKCTSETERDISDGMGIEIYGYVSKEPVMSSKEYEWFYVNKRIVRMKKFIGIVNDKYKRVYKYSKMFPVIILNVKCNENMYNVLTYNYQLKSMVINDNFLAKIEKVLKKFELLKNIFSDTQKSKTKIFINSPKKENHVTTRNVNGNNSMYNDYNIVSKAIDKKKNVRVAKKSILEIMELNNVNNPVYDTIGDVAIKKFERSVNMVITKEMIKNMIVVAQVDRKFIITRGGGCVFIIDQHAADERIQLNVLENEAYWSNAPKKNSKIIVKKKLNSCLVYNAKFFELQLVKQHEKDLKKWFWEVDYEIKKDLVGGRSRNGLFNNVVRVKTCPVVCGKVMGVEDMKSFLYQMKNNNFFRPKCIHDVLCSKACRSAIKFGDFLTVEKCQEIIDSLKSCAFPFQCAHGRPSIIPLFKYDTKKTKQKKKVEKI